VRILLEETARTIARAERAGVDPSWGAAVNDAVQTLAEATMHLGGLGMQGDIDGMMRHSADFLSLASITVVGWLWLWQAALAKEGLARGGAEADFYEGKLCAAQYWIHTELPRVAQLASLCRSGEDSYARMKDSWF
jgi:butyryl-CoA dehydrogenase